MNKEDKKLEEIIGVDALYSYVMIEVDTYIKTLNALEYNLKQDIKDLDLIVAVTTRISGLDNYVESLMMDKFYAAKNSIFSMRKKIKTFKKKLEVYFVHKSYEKNLFLEKVEELNLLAKDREMFIDQQIEKCIEYIGEYANIKC